jgi:polyisoprenoid-binding protein YceI
METSKWVIDPTHSELVFKVKHLMITTIKGEFRDFTAIIKGKDFTKSTVEVKINSNSVFTNNENRDDHLKSGDFFDTALFPTLTFTSTKMEPKRVDDYILHGDLTIKDITLPIVLNVEFGGTNKDPWGNEKVGFSISGEINRKDWGLNWNAALETGGLLVSDEVKIQGEIQFIKG